MADEAGGKRQGLNPRRFSISYMEFEPDWESNTIYIYICIYIYIYIYIYIFKITLAVVR